MAGDSRPRTRFARCIGMVHQFVREQFVPGDPVTVWEFFATPRNLATITPPAMRFEIVGRLPAAMYAGQMIEYRVGVFPGFATSWLTEITHVRPGEYFVDEQRVGPYRLWHHEHHFTPVPGKLGLQMTDRITYDAGWGPIGGLVNAVWLRRKLAAIFDFRSARIAELFPATP